MSKKAYIETLSQSVYLETMNKNIFDEIRQDILIGREPGQYAIEDRLRALGSPFPNVEREAQYKEVVRIIKERVKLEKILAKARIDATLPFFL